MPEDVDIRPKAYIGAAWTINSIYFISVRSVIE